MARKASKDETTEILEIVNFIKDRMATKDELRDFRNESHEHFLGIDTRLVSIEQELKDVKRRLAKIETDVEKFGNRYKEDIEELWKHVAVIEKRLKMQR